jgi:hypothetical protein
MSGEVLNKSGGVQITTVIKFTRYVWSKTEHVQKSLWKSTFEPNMSDSGDLTWVKVVRSDMSGLGGGHVQKTSVEPG